MSGWRLEPEKPWLCLTVSGTDQGAVIDPSVAFSSSPLPLQSKASGTGAVIGLSSYVKPTALLGQTDASVHHYPLPPGIPLHLGIGDATHLA